MAWFDEYTDFRTVGERTARAFQAPVGLASPLWFAFGAAASVGVAYWWMSRWAKPVNVEALAEIMTAPALVALAPVIEPETAAIELIAAGAAPVPVVDAAPAPAPTVEPVVEAAPAAAVQAKAAPKAKATPPVADDLTVMSGIGPKLSELLAERGVTRFAQIAKWTDEDLAEIDKALSLKGRAVREAWVAQAKRFAKAK